MKKKRIQDAIGETLCHDLTAILDDGYKGVKFKRGHVITEADLPELLRMGKEHVFVWDPADNEVHEEDCAIALADELLCEGMTASAVSEGKISLRTTKAGILQINLQGLRQLNKVPDWTVTSVQNHQALPSGCIFAAFRIVPLTTSKDNLDSAIRIAREAREKGNPIFRILPFQESKVGLIITGSEIFYKRIPDAFEPIMKQKLAAYPAELLPTHFCPDDEREILDALKSLKKAGCDLILLTGGMSVDPDDVTPLAIRSTGARVVTQGVPMQPGNMLTIGKWGTVYLVGVPGASMHAPRTSLDLFLPRFFSRLPFTRKELLDLANGGLAVPGIPLPWPTLPLTDSEKSGFTHQN